MDIFYLIAHVLIVHSVFVFDWRSRKQSQVLLTLSLLIQYIMHCCSLIIQRSIHTYIQFDRIKINHLASMNTYI